jgi:hypothetical protein
MITTPPHGLAVSWGVAGWDLPKAENTAAHDREWHSNNYVP